MRFSISFRWMCAVLAVSAGCGLGLAGADQPPATASAPAGDECHGLQEHLTASEEVLAERNTLLTGQLEEVAAALKALETEPESVPAAELAERKEGLLARRAALQGELKFLESARTAWQAALDACASASRFRTEQEQFRAEGERQADEFVSADLTAIQAQLAQVRSALGALGEPGEVRAERLDELAKLLDEADEQTRMLPDAERSALLAQAEATRHKRAALDAERALLELKLAAASEAIGAPATSQPAPATTAPAADEADAQNKQRLAEQLEAEARDRLGYARARLENIQRQLDSATATESDTTQLEYDRQRWQRIGAHEQRRLEQAELTQRAAQEQKAVGQLEQQLEDAADTREQLAAKRAEMTPPDREQQAAVYKEKAEDAAKAADLLDEQAAAAEAGIEPLQQLLPSLDAVQQALEERLAQTRGFADFQRLSRHVRQMREQLDAERQQIDLMVARTQIIVHLKMRQATLSRRLADLYIRCAEVLVPPVPSFWERQRKIINSILIVAAVVGISYGVKLTVWLIQGVLARLRRTLGGWRFSARRVGTLVSFVGSVVKLFAWAFGVMAVFREFGVDPAKSAGAIGLIGLIMAGMFQQLVVDFVKGLDIIFGRHYNVGDFVEVNGRLGHVVDLNVKHTRIRTLSGQEFNIPNSKCVPSRRFPDGYVDNYVDIALKSSADENSAREAIDAVCPDVNQRVEPVRGVPHLAKRFAGPHGRVVLRYRLRVLPGCDWVAKDHFIPAVKEALAQAGVTPAAEPNIFFINRIETFRRLFSRQLSEEEIVRDVVGQAPDPAGEDDARPPE